MVYTAICENRKSDSICKTDFCSTLPLVYRLLVEACSIKTVNIFVSVLFCATSVIGFQCAVADPLYDEPGINPYREQASQYGVDSVDPFLGQVKVRHLDLFLPGPGGMDILMWRTYDSANAGTPGMPAGEGFGVGWMSHVARLSNSCATSSITPVLELPDGTVQKFYVASLSLGYGFVSKEGWVGNCIGSAGMLLISPDGLKYEMSVSDGDRRLVKKITDKNGNWLNFDYGLKSLGYSPLQYLTSLTASDGRYVSFSYSAADMYGRRKLKNMYANGQSWSYDYVAFDGQPEYSSLSYSLRKATRSDGLSWTYEYPTLPGYNVFTPLQGYLGKFTHLHGAVTNYSYGYLYMDGLNAVRVTQKSMAVGSSSNTWNYRYKFNESFNGEYVTVTDVTDSLTGTVTYKHLNPGVNGKAWRFGLLVDKLECTSSKCTNNERYEWGYQEISSDDYIVNSGIVPIFDYATYRPLLTKKIVTRDGTAYSTQYSSYDSYGNPGGVAETGNGVSRTTDRTYYNNPGRWIIGKPAREVIDGTWVTDRAFDSNGNVVTVLKNGVRTTFSYHSTGDLASVTDANYNKISYSNYYRGVAGLEDQPGSVAIRRAINSTGTVASETNGEGSMTTYSYDSLNRLTQISPPIGNPTMIQRSGNSERINRGNFEETKQLDGLGRTIDTYKVDRISTTQTGIRQSYSYDVIGRKVRESYPTGASSSLPGIDYVYDNLDRVVTMRYADGRTRQFEYLAGNQMRVTNERGNATTYTYRSFGDPDERQLMNVSTPPAANMAITRNGLGQVTSMSQGSIARYMQYDSRGYLSQTYHPETGLVTYTRDNVGNPLSKSVGVAPSTRTINYTYDARNRLTATTFQDATTPPVTFNYNRVDDLISSSRGSVTRTYGYDLNRNLTSEALLVDGRTFNLGYLYDGNDAVSQVVYPDAETVGFYPNAFGWPSAVSPYVTGMVYHPTGQVSSMSYANGVTTTQAFNSRQWPVQMSVSTLAASLINTAYGYDGIGSVTSITDSINAGYNRTLGYDGAERLISAVGPWGAGSITYDGQGNILSQTYGTAYAKTYTYDTTNRLASYTGSTAFTYDAWGNATRSGTALSYHLYDDASNLYCASCDTASPLRFEYDANNYRVKKTRNGIVTYSLYAKDGNLMMEYTPSKGDLKQFAYHNKKQVAMRHVIDPALNIGQVSTASPSRLATIIPRKPVAIDTDPVFTLVPFDSLLSVALLAHAN